MKITPSTVLSLVLFSFLAVSLFGQSPMPVYQSNLDATEYAIKIRVIEVIGCESKTLNVLYFNYKNDTTEVLYMEPSMNNSTRFLSVIPGNEIKEIATLEHHSIEAGCTEESCPFFIEFDDGVNRQRYSLDSENKNVLEEWSKEFEIVPGHNRSVLTHENFNDLAAGITWKSDIVGGSSSQDTTENYYILHITDSSYHVKVYGSVHYEITCQLETQIANDLFKFRSFHCEKRMGVQTIFGFFEDGNLYLAFKLFDHELNNDLLQVIENDHGWKKFYPVREQKE